LAQAWIAGRLRDGAVAVDATAGNGQDTVFLAGQVGPAGRVIAYDVQEVAILRTRERLEAAGLSDRVELRLACHRGLGADAPFQAVMFNLGYRPGGDAAWITRPESTLPALEAAAAGLLPGGLVTVVCYPGHPGGREEAEAVVAWARGLDAVRFRAIRTDNLVEGAPGPFLVAVERRAGAVQEPG
jgi:hypothetical protein